jgi:hypothetical protein
VPNTLGLGLNWSCAGKRDACQHPDETPATREPPIGTPTHGCAGQ